MPRLVVTAAILTALLSLLFSGKAFGRPDTSLTGTAVWTGGPGGTYAVQGTFVGGLGTGTYDGTLVEGAVLGPTPNCPGPHCTPITGTIRFSSKRGDFTAVVDPGGVVGIEEIASHSFRTFALRLRIVAGTRGYAHADGVLTLAYSSVWTHTVLGPVPDNHIDDTGTLTGNPHGND